MLSRRKADRRRKSFGCVRPLMANRMLESLVRIADRRRDVIEGALRSMGLTRLPHSVRLDKSGSVSALVEVEELYAFVTEDMTAAERRSHHGP